MEIVGGLVVLSRVGAPGIEAWIWERWTCVPEPERYFVEGARGRPGCARGGRVVVIIEGGALVEVVVLDNEVAVALQAWHLTALCLTIRNYFALIPLEE